MDFENKLTKVLEKLNKIEVVQIANFLQIDIEETEKEIAHNMLSVLTDLINFSSNFESYCDTVCSESVKIFNKQMRIHISHQNRRKVNFPLVHN